MYTIYTAPLSVVIRQHTIMYHRVADDTHIHCNNDVNSVQDASVRLQNCISDVSSWMSKNTLKINEDNTRFIITLHTFDTLSIKFGTNTIPNSNIVRILRITLDPHMTLERQISNVCRCSYIKIRKINSIQRYLTEQVLKH